MKIPIEPQYSSEKIASWTQLCLISETSMFELQTLGRKLYYSQRFADNKIGSKKVILRLRVIGNNIMEKSLVNTSIRSELDGFAKYCKQIFIND